MKAMICLSMCALMLILSTSAQAGGIAPPAKIDRNSHAEWVRQIRGNESPYADFVFSWFEEQLNKPLPPQVAEDPDKLMVSITRPLAAAVNVEGSGDVEEGTSYGLETYAVIDAPIEMVLETILFRWGKPVGAEYGVTHPIDIVYGYREERLTPEWGMGSYKTFTIRRNGGIAGQMNDSFSLLVRGNPSEGYVLAGNFLGPIADTTTSSSLTIILIRPLSGGKTEYRVAGMQTGQNYSYLGVDYGRRTFGFNATRIREGQLDFLSHVKSLRQTGKIPERK